jgi:hypothetical protein
MVSPAGTSIHKRSIMVKAGLHADGDFPFVSASRQSFCFNIAFLVDAHTQSDSRAMENACDDALMP